MSCCIMNMRKYVKAEFPSPNNSVPLIVHNVKFNCLSKLDKTF